MIRVQDAECGTQRQATPYGAGYSHCSATGEEEACAPGEFLRSLPISELRRRLDRLGIEHGRCVEKVELINMLSEGGPRQPP